MPLRKIDRSPSTAEPRRAPWKNRGQVEDHLRAKRFWERMRLILQRKRKPKTKHVQLEYPQPVDTVEISEAGRQAAAEAAKRKGGMSARTLHLG